MSDKICNKCNTLKPLSDFGTRWVQGSPYPRTYCRPCFNKRNNECPGKAATRERVHKKRLKRLSQERSENHDQDKFIFWDSRGADRKFGRQNDLTREFICEAIKDGCTYCGETELRMTLDRIDNAIGHTQANVVAACIRCNLTRGSMPHEAWEVVAKGMRIAREAGHFGDWTRQIHK